MLKFDGMLKKQHIGIWAIFILSLIIHQIVDDSGIYFDQEEDPTNCILSYVNEQHTLLEEQYIPLVLGRYEEGVDVGLDIDNQMNKHKLSLRIEKDGKELFRSHSVLGKSVCNVLILDGPVRVHRCVGLFDESGFLNEEIVSNCSLSNQYRIEQKDGIPIFLDNEQILLAPIHTIVKEMHWWLVLPFYCSLLLLLIIPFKYQFKKEGIKWFLSIALVLLIYQFSYYGSDDLVQLNKLDWRLPMALLALFTTLFYWRREHTFPIGSDGGKLVLQWFVLLSPVVLIAFSLRAIQDLQNADLAFESLAKISVQDIYLVVSLVILMLAHLISLHQNWIFMKKKFLVSKKYLMLGCLLVVIHFSIFYFLVENFPPIPIFLSMIIYLLLIDLFTEGKQNPVLWTILWNVFLSTLIAGSIYHTDFGANLRLVSENIENGVYASKSDKYKEYQASKLPSQYVEKVKEFTDVGIQTFYEKSKIHFIHHKSNGNFGVVQFDIPGFIKAITLFSFVFIIGISGFFFLTLFHKRINLLPRYFYPGDVYLSSFSRRIQISYLILTIISFLGIAAITIVLLNNYFKSNERQSLKNNLNLIKSQIEFALSEAEGDRDQVIKNISAIQNTELFEVHVFDKKGEDLMDKRTFISSSVVQYLINNTEGSLSRELTDKGFNSYVHLNHKNYPFALVKGMNNQDSNALSIYDFIAGILNVYVFLFILAITFGLFISKSIVDPLSRLSKQMQQLKLGKVNQKIEWSGEGEVGDLIRNYNAMVHQLEESVSMIAHTERDMAWREMARQVAHEIKNPLTPMKLKLQYLQKQVAEGKIPEKENLDRISATLLEQIENLSNISGAFSNVAKMPKASNEKVILNEVVESVHDLFRKREDMHIRLTEPINDLFVFADKNHLVRILNNMVKNAIEAIPEDRMGEIEISLYKEGNNAIIKVSDNGQGIPSSMVDKIFTPKFTTKNSGSGLGLAISANMAESFNGRIYFESKESVGTSFFLQTPLMRLSENKDQNRVSLD